MLRLMLMKIVHAQTVLPESVLKELKKKTGESATKDALAKAVELCLKCPHPDDCPLLKERRKV